MKKRIATTALALFLLLPFVLALAGCASDSAQVLRVYNWED